MLRNRQRPVGLNKRLISLALVCIMIPLSVIGVSWARNAAQLITEQAINSAEARLTQTSRVLSLMIDNVELLYEALYTSEAVGEYANMADGAFLEKERAPYQSLARTNLYTKNKGAVRNLLMAQSSSLDVINSIYYYDVAKNVVMSYRWLDSTIEKFFDLMWLQEINTAAKETTVLPVRTINPAYNEQYDVLSIVYMPYRKNTQPFYIVFNLDANILYNQYLYHEDIDENNVLLLLDEAGRIMLAACGDKLIDTSAAEAEYAACITSLQTMAGSVAKDGNIVSAATVDSMKHAADA